MTLALLNFITFSATTFVTSVFNLYLHKTQDNFIKLNNTE